MNKRIAAALAGIAVGVTTLTSVALATPAEEPREPADNTRDVICRVLDELNDLEGVDLDDILTDLDCEDEDPTSTTTRTTTTAANGGGGGGAAVGSRYKPEKPENPNHYVPKPNDYLDIPKPNDFLDL